MLGGAVVEEAEHAPDSGEGSSELEEAFLGALLGGDFAKARTLAGPGPEGTSPYRGAAAAQAFPAFARAVDRLEAGEPVAAYFVVADAADGSEHVLQSTLMHAIAAACESAGEREVARAAYEAGGNVLEAIRLENELPMTRLAMDRKVDQAGIAHHRAALEADPDDVDAMEGLALRLGSDCEYDEAWNVARRTVERFPSRAGSHLVLVDALVGREQLDEAFAAAERATEACPGAPLLWMKRGELAFTHNDDLETALGHYRHALEIDETLWEAHHHAELLLNLLKDREARVLQLARMLPFAPTADERDRIADALDRARAEIAGGEAIPDAERRIQKRQEQRADDIERGLRIPDRRDRKPGMSVGSALLLAMIIAFILLILKLNR